MPASSRAWWSVLFNPLASSLGGNLKSVDGGADLVPHGRPAPLRVVDRHGRHGAHQVQQRPGPARLHARGVRRKGLQERQRRGELGKVHGLCDSVEIDPVDARYSTWAAAAAVPSPASPPADCPRHRGSITSTRSPSTPPVTGTCSSPPTTRPSPASISERRAGRHFVRRGPRGQNGLRRFQRAGAAPDPGRFDDQEQLVPRRRPGRVLPRRGSLWCRRLRRRRFQAQPEHPGELSRCGRQ